VKRNFLKGVVTQTKAKDRESTRRTVDVERILDGVQRFSGWSIGLERDDRLNQIHGRNTLSSGSNSLDIETFMEHLANGKYGSKSDLLYIFQT
jgi:hypothetical protein